MTHSLHEVGPDGTVYPLGKKFRDTMARAIHGAANAAASDSSGLGERSHTSPSLPSSTHAGGELPPLTMYGHFHLVRRDFAARHFAFEYEAKAALGDYPKGHAYCVKPLDFLGPQGDA